MSRYLFFDCHHVCSTKYDECMFWFGYRNRIHRNQPDENVKSPSNGLSNGQAATQSDANSITANTSESPRSSPEGDRGHPVGSDSVVVHSSINETRPEPTGREQTVTPPNGTVPQPNIPAVPEAQQRQTPLDKSTTRSMNEVPAGATTTDLPDGVLYKVN